MDFLYSSFPPLRAHARKTVCAQTHTHTRTPYLSAFPSAYVKTHVLVSPYRRSPTIARRTGSVFTPDPFESGVKVLPCFRRSATLPPANATVHHRQDHRKDLPLVPYLPLSGIYLCAIQSHLVGKFFLPISVVCVAKCARCTDFLFSGASFSMLVAILVSKSCRAFVFVGGRFRCTAEVLPNASHLYLYSPFLHNALCVTRNATPIKFAWESGQMWKHRKPCSFF